MPRFLRQFGLRTLLILCTLAAACFGLWRWHMEWVQQQHEIAGQIADARGDVRWGTWGPQWAHQLFGSYYFSNIIAVDWHHKRITDEHLQLLRQTPTLEELYIPGTRVQDESLAVLEDLPRIRKLALWSNRLTNASLEHVGKLKQLEVLDIHRTKMNEEGLVHLRGLPRLQILRQDMKMTDVGVDHLASLPQLTLESLMTEHLHFESFEHLRDDIRVKQLYLTRPAYDQWATYLAGHPTLVSLEVTGAPMTDEELQTMIAADSLIELGLSNVPVGDAGIANVPHASRLKSFRLAHTKVTPEGFLMTFGQYPKSVVVLRDWIRLFNASNGQRADWMGTLAAGDLESLQYCRNADLLIFHTSQLKGVKFQWLPQLEKLELLHVDLYGSDALLENIAPLKNLKKLNLAGAKKITRTGLQAITSLDQLTTLELRSADISDDALQVIGQMKQLEILDVTGTNITDQGIAYLASLQNLVVLNVSRCQNLTNDSLKTIAQLKKLRDLTAQDTQFDDQGLTHLHGMPRLSNVSVLGSKHTRVGLQALRDSLPNKGGSIY